MKCYFACNSGVSDSKVYRDLLEVTLKTARKNTTLDLYCLYDGTPDDPACTIMRKYGVHVVFHRITFEKELLELYTPEYMQQRLGRVEEMEGVIGTFTRMDVPLLEADEEFVLFCDVDVMFLQDIRQEELPRPKYCAAAPEIRQDWDVSLRGHKYFNAGVMYLNVSGMRKKRDAFLSMLRQKQSSKIECFDQGYLNHLCEQDFDELGLEYNWKPYWGINGNAKIVHMHAAKPNGPYRACEFYDFVLGTFGDCIAGSAYYYLTFFEVLETSAPPWLREHIKFLVHEKAKVQKRFAAETIPVEERRRRRRRFLVCALVSLVSSAVGALAMRLLS
jgi:hypothetical protein